ncbi:M23 family metallopeptidase [Sphingobium nicotianae]|uniref:M23 family metallopeptidase n=1 Tax=Sphingobium nicotianae TaxID=2782607 RepID=A0A9X1IPS2_9SPHN|nr:M23 family metallopeptidase [Sphingobium nicotianae]MBT2186224.1 M23 family metallopeptidase [Sphingobium nicotianae]
MIFRCHRPGSRAALALALALITGSCAPVAQPGASPPPAPPAPQAPPAPVAIGPATLLLFGTPRQGALLRGLVPGGIRSLTLDGDPVAYDAEGNFIIAFDRDASPSARLVATLANGETQTRTLDVAPGHWKIEQVNASPTGSATSEEFKALRADELAQISAARARGEPSDGWRQHFIWPVRARISGVFGSQRIYRGQPGSYHSGLDLAGGAGTTYVAPADGVVILVAGHPFTLEGNLLMIDHGMGLNSAFLHSQRVLVKVGDVVRQGQPIGMIGATGRVTGPHLHWSMKWHAARIDPLMLLANDPDRSRSP